jgi:hypothetical protein
MLDGVCLVCAGSRAPEATVLAEGLAVGEFIGTGVTTAVFIETAAVALVTVVVGSVAVPGVGWISGKYLALSAGVRVSASYSIVPTALLHFTFAPSLSTESKVREEPFAKVSVVTLQAEREPAISRRKRQQPTNL